MIFVTVGTHEQSFNRLLRYMDRWAMLHSEKVVMQTGFSDFEPVYSFYQRFFSQEEMDAYRMDARIVITHGGPSSFIPVLESGRVPIIVPRQYEEGEHVNNHQVEFCDKYKDYSNQIIVVKNIDDLGETIRGYYGLLQLLKGKFVSNNKVFCEKLSQCLQI